MFWSIKQEGPTGATHLQPDILGGRGDGGDLEGGLAVPGGQLTGIHVVLWGQLRLHAHRDPICRASIWIGHLDLWGGGGAAIMTAIRETARTLVVAEASPAEHNSHLAWEKLMNHANTL